ncbi:M56 family metallopeptidase [Saccharothrix sp.]|uniref:M56 family metallopeptidase n=1 Tax=Saccharothrix sp. TaxID=1873460 RepID=UPI002810BAC0|nr:M56 family metallopeptidase [Saccharothrix sp.]
MSAALHLAVTLVLCGCLAGPLAGARWVWRSPRTGILLWQMLACTWVLSIVGLLLAVGLARFPGSIPAGLVALARDPAHWGVVPVVVGLALGGWLVGAVVWSWLAVARVRRRHRDVLALVARRDRDVPGAVVVDSPLPIAYCLPGTVVVSSGAVRALTRDELLAVLAHEHAHGRERHDLVLLPFTALRRLVPRRITAAVALLVEMRADDNARREHGAAPLASALRRFRDAPPPAGALGVAGDIDVRLERLAGTVPLTAFARWSALVGGLVLVTTPISFVLW